MKSAGPVLRTARQADLDAIVALNHSEVQWTSEMDLKRLCYLNDQSCYHKVVEVGADVGSAVAGFLLAMDQSADYSNDNFEFFKARFKRFVYIDRIVIGQAWAGQKLGTILYQDLFQYGETVGAEVLACEYNLAPLNAPSKAFHDGFGFSEIGQQKVGGDKLVSLQVASVSSNG